MKAFNSDKYYKNGEIPEEDDDELDSVGVLSTEEKYEKVAALTRFQINHCLLEI